MCLSGARMSSDQNPVAVCLSQLSRRDSGVDVGSRRNSIHDVLQTVTPCHSHGQPIIPMATQQDMSFMKLSSRAAIQKSISFQATQPDNSLVESAKRSYESALSQTLVFQVPKRQKSCPAISALHDNCYPTIQILSSNYKKSQQYVRSSYDTDTITFRPFSPHDTLPTSAPTEIKVAKRDDCKKLCKYKPSKRLLALLCADTRHIPRQLPCMEYTAVYHLRKEVIRWVHQINAGFLCFHPETVFMAINFLDRFMEKSNLRWRQRIYQVALGCVYIAGKFNEETREPMICDMVECARYATSAEKIKKVEKEILSVLCWEIRITTPQAMLDELLYCLPEARSTPEQCAYSDQVIGAAQLYLDVASTEWAYIRYPPSILAVSAFKCGLMHLDFDDLNETVDIACSLTSVCQESLRSCVEMMQNLCVKRRDRRS